MAAKVVELRLCVTVCVSVCMCVCVCVRVWQDADHVYYVFEYVPGGELFSRLRIVKRFPNDVALFYAAELLLAIQAVHNW
jgi:serine/threonine protein kinase